MKNNRSLSMFSSAVLLFVLCCLCSSAAAEEFTGLNDYQLWAANKGYPEGLLIDMGIAGVNQDHFHSLPYTSGYTSGKIVIGDSRCCQLGIWQSRSGTDDYAVFAVWGGHYVPGTGTPALTDAYLFEIEQCFHEQVRTVGDCTVFFFATVNDFDYLNNNNSSFISAAVASAEMIASMSYEYEGAVFHPKVIVIGLEGVRTSGDIFGIPHDVFNRYIDSYNNELRKAVNNSAVLKETASLFTTVSEITEGKTTFISDGLHYSDPTLKMISDYLVKIGEEGKPDAEITVRGKNPENANAAAAGEYSYEEPILILYRIGN